MRAFASVLALIAIGLPAAAILSWRIGPIGIAALAPGVVAVAVADINDRRALRRQTRGL
jgi:hypothetical protein